ncbi:hypothetical protein TNCV_2099411 [Trichonephila clavipes]|nr:hypothetical protein TNCV_2099411 [Trichonephila clavipes]
MTGSFLPGITLGVRLLCCSSIGISGPVCQIHTSELSVHVMFHPTTTLPADEMMLHSEGGVAFDMNNGSRC